MSSADIYIYIFSPEDAYPSVVTRVFFQIQKNRRWSGRRILIGSTPPGPFVVLCCGVQLHCCAVLLWCTTVLY